MIESLVSIIIPFYNKQNTIRRAVNSVLDQSYHNWELIIIDDCSKNPINEDLVPIDPRIIILKNEQNLGAAQTRQKGLQISKGEFIAFLDADDWWHRHFLEICVNSLLSSKQSDGAYVKSVIFFSDGSQKIRQYCDLGLNNIRETLIQYARPWQTGGILWRMTSCGSWGSLKTNEDSWFEISSAKFNKLIAINKEAYFIDQTGENHLSSMYSRCEVIRDNLQIFIHIYQQHREKLNLKYRIILLNRLLRCHLRVIEYCSAYERQVLSNRIKDMSPLIGLIIRSKLVLKATHKLLQATQFKIHL